jgi:hydroxymethylpyrimidine pyrophosphatase-like HAD family hydrolase
MRFHALACDYDGTIATEGRVPPKVVEALEQLKRSGRALVLVSGRTHDEWIRRFPGATLFDRVILENGAVLFRPETGELRALAPAPPAEFARALRERGVRPLAQGKVIVATVRPHETTVQGVIRDLGLDMDVIFNKGAVMALPSGVNKASGLAVALEELGLSPHNVVGVGDAENDQAFLEHCEFAVAVANALPSLKEKVDWITRAAEGEGVAEIAALLVENDFRDAEPRHPRHG